MQFCQHCGSQNTDSAKFCLNCGQSLSMSQLSGPKPQSGTLALQTLLNKRYLIVQLLGQGGMGAVYLAHDQGAFNRRCVVKEMLPYYQTAAEQAKAEQDFEREARTLANLRHDGVPQIYEYFIEKGRYYLVMEFVEGENLEERMARTGRPISEAEALDYGLQLARILIYLGKQTPPVIHRDIKPANIIVNDERNKVKLVDFGLAKETTGSGLSGAMSMPLGTPGYAPPEQYSGKVEPRTDIFGMGVTLHHILTGRDPRNHTPFDFPPIGQLAPGITGALEKAVAQMVETDVARRATASEVRDIFESLVQPKAAAGSQTAPFTLRSGKVAHDPTQLGLMCDAHWEDGVYHLYEGHFEPWLERHNRSDLAMRARSIRTRGGDRSSGLEEFLRAADPTIPLPSLAVASNSFSLGQVEKGSIATGSIRIRNAGRGCVFGTVVPKVGWATIRPLEFSLLSGRELVLTVHVNTGQLPEGTLTEEVLELQSNGGNEAISCELTVVWPPELIVEPNSKLSLGDISLVQPQPVSQMVTVRNGGGGTLSGQISSSFDWLSTDAVDFSLVSGQSKQIQVTAKPDGIGDQGASGRIVFEAANGSFALDVYVGVRKDWYDNTSRTKVWLLYAPILLAGYLGQIVPLSLATLVAMGLPQPSGLVTGLLLLAFVLSVWVLRFSTRWIKQLDELENYYHRGNLENDIPASVFSTKKILVSVGVGGFAGAVLGWRYAGAAANGGLAVWILFGIVGGMLVGGLATAIGRGSPTLPTAYPWLVRMWSGDTLDSSSTYLSARTIGLVVSSIFFASMLDVLGGHDLRIWPGILGGLIGAILASEGQRHIALRVRWLLSYARLSLTIGLLAVGALTVLMLIRYASVWPLLKGYANISFVYPGLPFLFWVALLLVCGFFGAWVGLWVLDGLDTSWKRAERTFLGLTGLLLVLGIPLYLLAEVLFSFFNSPILQNSGVVILMIAGQGTAGWALRAQRRRMEEAWRQTQLGLSKGTIQFRDITRSRIGLFMSKLVPQGSVSGVWGKVQPVFGKLNRFVPSFPSSSAQLIPTLSELESHASLPLVIGAISAAFVLQKPVISLAIGVAVGLGILAVYFLIFAGLVIGALLAVRYIQTR